MAAERLTQRLLLATCAALLSCATTHAQSMIAGISGAASARSGIHALTDPHAITFEDIHRAENMLWARVMQTRFTATIDAQTQLERWVGLVESLSLAPPDPRLGPHARPRFDLQLVTELGFDLEFEARQQAVHYQHRAFLHLHGGFRVHDPIQAAQRYSIHFVESDFRLGRPVFRVAVMPVDPNAHVWVLDLDVETGYPLTKSEYTPSGRIQSSIQALSFEHGLPARAQIETTADWWDPQTIAWFSDPETARSTMLEGQSIEVPTFSPQGFTLHSSSVVYDALAGEESLALHYTDGIRSIVQLQTANVPPLDLSYLQTGVGKDSDYYAILDFSDLTTSQLMFQVGGVRYLVLGSADTPSLDGFAEGLLRSRLQ